MIKIVHNPRCSKSRQAYNLLVEKGYEVEEILYMKNPLTKEELKDIITKLGIKPFDLIRTKEAEFKDNYKDKELSDDQWIDAMVKFPRLIERPIVIKDNKAIIGRPTEKILEIIS